ncbi:serine/threonine protein kinase [Streptomyces sp. NBC_00876]|uniref:serine/threonine-protein kinase n=1 Tax=Streptomyces sp. NBC_00876 TaxID=2975853 RepID=UPI00386A302B|nr:serine/threonine protein kinase [Streptomyces sp. NBC_00876]
MREGEVLDGRFALLRQLSATTTSEVWQGFDQEMSRPVALKFLPADVDESLRDSLVERFKREAAVLSLLEHPSIPSIYEIRNRENGFDSAPYLVREMVTGSTLASVLSRTRPPTSQVLQVALQVSEALEAVHSRGVIHRDLKPSNLIIDESGKVHLLDFGIAQVMGSGPPKATVAGTPRYMAPEQVTAGQLDGSVDVYALGIILYEMLSERPEIRDEETPPEDPFRLVWDSPTPLRLNHLEVPVGLYELTSQMMAKSPESRPNAAEVLAAIRAFLPSDNGEPVSALSEVEYEGLETEAQPAEIVPPSWYIQARDLSDSTIERPVTSLDPTASWRLARMAWGSGLDVPRVDRGEDSPHVPLVSAESEGPALSGQAVDEEDLGSAVETVESALARLFVRLGPPPESAVNETAPAGSDGGGVAE